MNLTIGARLRRRVATGPGTSLVFLKFGVYRVFWWAATCLYMNRLELDSVAKLGVVSVGNWIPKRSTM